MLKILAGVLSFGGFAYLAITVIYPFIFNSIHGLFENNDLGVVLALVACFFATGILIWIAIAITAFAVTLVSVGEDRQRIARNRQRLRRIGR